MLFSSHIIVILSSELFNIHEHTSCNNSQCGTTLTWYIAICYIGYCSEHLNHRPNTTSTTTLRPPDLQSLPVPDASLLTVSQWPNASLSTCSSSASSVPPPVPGLHPSTWSPRRPPVTGDPVVTTVPSTSPPCRTATLSLTYMTFLPLYRVPHFSPN